MDGIYSFTLPINLNESKVIPMMIIDAITTMISISLVVGPKIGSGLIIRHTAGTRNRPSTKAIIVPDRIACNSLVCIIVLSLFMVFRGYSSIL